MNDFGWPEWRSPDTGEFLQLDGDGLVSPLGERFPVISGIPRFVSGPNYADAFGEQWKKFRQTQLDSHTGTSITTDRVRRCIGESLWSRLAGKHVLECGCGAGRFTEVLLAQGALVTSTDLSSAVEANRANFFGHPRHRIAQADLFHLPFAGGEFDMVFCLGVIQHTPDPDAALAALYEHVRPGGALVIDHYRRDLGWYVSVKPLFRHVLKRLPAGRALAVSAQLVDLFLPLHRRARHSRLGRSFLGRVSPILQYYDSLPQLAPQAQREWAVLDTHDALTDWYKHWRTPEQIRAALEDLGLHDIWCEAGGNGVEARGRRPPA
jgi:2-polyprenyl-3-methyl-5-hydroxy-6-metoxy-1,4-benzoquinol methylase